MDSKEQETTDLTFTWASERARELLSEMKKLPNEERLKILDIITDEICVHCGDNCGWSCQCMNDE